MGVDAANLQMSHTWQQPTSRTLSFVPSSVPMIHQKLESLKTLSNNSGKYHCSSLLWKTEKDGDESQSPTVTSNQSSTLSPDGGGNAPITAMSSMRSCPLPPVTGLHRLSLVEGDITRVVRFLPDDRGLMQVVPHLARDAYFPDEFVACFWSKSERAASRQRAMQWARELAVADSQWVPLLDGDGVISATALSRVCVLVDKLAWMQRRRHRPGRGPRVATENDDDDNGWSSGHCAVLTEARHAYEGWLTGGDGSAPHRDDPTSDGLERPDRRGLERLVRNTADVDDPPGQSSRRERALRSHMRRMVQLGRDGGNGISAASLATVAQRFSLPDRIFAQLVGEADAVTTAMGASLIRGSTEGGVLFD